MAASPLVITNLSVAIGDTPILKRLSLTIAPGRVAALLGPNGSGKSTLAATLIGHPDYRVTSGTVRWQGKNILKLEPWERARLGLFLAFQHPSTLPGVTLEEFLWTAATSSAPAISREDFTARCAAAFKLLKLPPSFLTRMINDGWSGGEKKKGEMVQLLVLRPKLAILDETDSGLDVDALRLVAKAIALAAKEYRVGILVITHYQRLLDFLQPQTVTVLSAGRVAAQGGKAIMAKVARQGYAWLPTA